MKKFLGLAAATALTTFAATAAYATPTPITTPGLSFSGGGATYSNFGCSITPNPSLPGTTPTNCNQVSVDLTSTNPGNLQFTSLWSATGITFTDNLITYQVVDPNGISMIDLDFNGTWQGFAITGVTETVKDAAGTIVGQLSVSCTTLSNPCDLQDPPYEKADIPLNGTYTELFVTKDIDVGAFLGSGTISFIDQSFHTAVPEPATMALLGTGLIGLAALRRRRSAS